VTATAPDDVRDDAGPGLDFPTAWARSRAARVVRAFLQDVIIIPLVWLLAPGSRRGLGMLKRHEGPYIVASNHQSHADTSIVLAALPRSLRRRLVVAAASDTFFNTRFHAIFAALVYNAIPIERHKVNRRSGDLARQLLDEGWGLLIYPEGGRSPDGRIHEFKGGAAYLADKSAAPVLPCYLENTRFVLPRLFAKSLPEPGDTHARIRTQVSVTFGPAIEKGEAESIRKLNRRIEEAIVHLGRDVAGDPLASPPLVG
jgi:1-acyl-sn-glycerol-3-phosphate acyltransferase